MSNTIKVYMRVTQSKFEEKTPNPPKKLQTGGALSASPGSAFGDFHQVFLDDVAFTDFILRIKIKLIRNIKSERKGLQTDM